VIAGADILRHVVQGERVADIACELTSTESSMRCRLSSTYQKFGAHSQHGEMNG
jgi:DNA-binding NarL/FixJ family response regulator